MSLSPSSSSSTTVAVESRPSFDIDHYLNRFVPRPRLYLLPKPLSRVLGYRSPGTSSQIGTLLISFYAFIGAFAGLCLTSLIYHALPNLNNNNNNSLTTINAPSSSPATNPIIIASLGATAILEYNAINSPLAQPRNVILGQTISSIIGISITKLFALTPHPAKLSWLAGSLAVALSSALMTLTKTVHPPAGATALLAATSSQITDLGWLLLPLILLGSVVMLLVACLVNNIQRQFPLFWWTEHDLARGGGSSGVADAEKDGEKDTDQAVHAEELGDGEIVVSSAGVCVPYCVVLSSDEMAFLEVLRGRLKCQRRGRCSCGERHRG